MHYFLIFILDYYKIWTWTPLFCLCCLSINLCPCPPIISSLSFNIVMILIQSTLLSVILFYQFLFLLNLKLDALNFPLWRPLSLWVWITSYPTPHPPTHSLSLKKSASLISFSALIFFIFLLLCSYLLPNIVSTYWCLFFTKYLPQPQQILTLLLKWFWTITNYFLNMKLEGFMFYTYLNIVFDTIVIITLNVFLFLSLILFWLDQFVIHVSVTLYLPIRSVRRWLSMIFFCFCVVCKQRHWQIFFRVISVFGRQSNGPSKQFHIQPESLEPTNIFCHMAVYLAYCNFTWYTHSPTHLKIFLLQRMCAIKIQDSLDLWRYNESQHNVRVTQYLSILLFQGFWQTWKCCQIIILGF